jgi:hypothetical protein
MSCFCRTIMSRSLHFHVPRLQHPGQPARLLSALAILMLALGLTPLGPASASAGGNPSIKWAGAAARNDSASMLARKFDLMTVTSNSVYPALMQAVRPDFKCLRYTNMTNNNRSSDGDKYVALQNACKIAGIDFETMWLHFASDQVVGINDDWFREDRLGGAEGSAGILPSGVYLYHSDDPTNPHNITYGAYNTKALTITTGVTDTTLGHDGVYRYDFLKYSGDAIYMGYPERFSKLEFLLSHAAGSDLRVVWEYQRSDSTWAPLTVNDSTGAFARSGNIRFTPPTDWGYLSIQPNSAWSGIGLQREYWLRCRATSASSSTPSFWWVCKEKFFGPRLEKYIYYIRGWDPRNDVNGDGWVSDAEYASLVNPQATARFKYQARVPSYTVGFERYVANVGSVNYRRWSAAWDSMQCVGGLFPGGANVAGTFEDNCVPYDGSQPMADSTTVGAYSIPGSPYNALNDRINTYIHFGGLPTDGHVLEYPGAGPGRRFHQDHLRADSTTYASLNAIGKIYAGNCSQSYCNTSHYHWPGLPNSITNGDSGGYYSYRNHHMADREMWSVPIQTVWNEGLESPTRDIDTQILYARELTSNGRMGLFITRQSVNDADYSPGRITRDRDRMYGLGYFYLIANPNAYCFWLCTDCVGPTDSTSWWPAVGYDIGTPLSDSVFIYQSGIDSNGESYRIYARRFSKALVLVKPKANYTSPVADVDLGYGWPASPITSVTFTDGKPRRRLGYNGMLGSPVTSVILKNCEAAIMVDTAGVPADVTSPDAVGNMAGAFKVMSVSPASQGVAGAGTTIKVDLSEPVDPASVGASTLLASGSVSGSHTGRISVVGRYLTFTPDAVFTRGEDVNVRLQGTLRSTFGRTLDGDGDGAPGGDKVWSFKVADY